MRLKLAIILSILSFNLFAQVSKNKLVTAQKIFDNLVNAYSSNKGSPSLKIIPKSSSGSIAQYLTYPFPTVQIDEAVFDICMGFGKDSANALAIILSHELAHYYNDHSWCSDYAFALRNSQLGNTLRSISKESKIEKESIADSYGLFYSSLAGYKPFDVFNLLLDKIYKQYKLPENVPGYPSKKERKEINRVQKEKIQNLVPVFEAGIIMQRLKYYEVASSCFEYLTKFFPSREIYNNYGVCEMSMALNYKPGEIVNFIYPVEIDASSRIYSQADRGNDTLNTGIKFRELTQKAKNAFDKAISLDPKYIKSYINLACLYDIRGNYQAALGVVTELENLTPEFNPDILLIKAIALYHNKNVSQSEKVLQEIDKYPNTIYEYNYKLLVNSVTFKNDMQAIEKWKDSWVNERVFRNPDTCNSRYQLLSGMLADKSTIPLQSINEFLSIGKATSSGSSVFIIETKSKKIILNVSIFNASTDKPIDSNKFITNNGKCFSMQMAGATWSVVYKELLDE